MTLKIGILGVGGGVGSSRGMSFARVTRALGEDAAVAAVCDIVPQYADRGAAEVGARAFYDYGQMLESGIDAVVIATPLPLHADQAVAALQHGVHVLSEVTACHDLASAERLAQAACASTAVYMLSENYRYFDQVELLRRMAVDGRFGDIYYAEGEYLHELSVLHHYPDGSPTWRYYWQVGVNGSTYPTHSLGPCLQWVKERPTCISCIGTGRWTDPEHAMEDTVLLLCKTASGKLMRVRVDMLSKRPHAMTNYTLQGTRGAYESPRRHGEGHWVWVEGYSRDASQWQPLEDFEAEYLPEMWRNPPPEAASAGHGGGDYFEVMDFVDAMKGLRPPPTGIHEAMDMTLPGLVSQQSIAMGGAWLPVPDTRGW